MKREVLESFLDNPNVRTGLDLIALSEGTYHSPDPYNTLFGGGIIGQDGNVPFQPKKFKLKDKEYTSTATGRYQFLKPTWEDLGKRYAIDTHDLSPRNQDLSALYLINDRNALEDMANGEYHKAFKKLNKVWASLEGSPYGQPTNRTDDLLAQLGINQKKKINLLSNNTPRSFYVDNTGKYYSPAKKEVQKLMDDITTSMFHDDPVTNKKIQGKIGTIVDYASERIHPSVLSQLTKAYARGGLELSDLLVKLLAKSS